jgi:hypothetical protein
LLLVSDAVLRRVASGPAGSKPPPNATKSLSAAGFRDPAAESSQVADLLAKKFGQGDA